MAVLERPFLLDTTRLVSRSWTGRRSTGIDRVCYAYLSRFKAQAQAVVQVHGVARVLPPRQSDRLFAMLEGHDATFRRDLMGFAPAALARSRSRIDGRGAVYLNSSHTDFDLRRHAGWVRSCRLRPVYFLHDLIPISHALLCRPQARKRHLGRVTGALRNAAGIIVNSQCTARELQSFAHERDLPLPPVLAAPLAGADLSAAIGVTPAARVASGGYPYFLCVGTIEPRKNHLLLLQAWQRLVDCLGAAAPRLLIAGQWGRNSDPVRSMLGSSPQLQSHVELVEGCSDEELGGWIKGARALLLPTLAEGFGLPLVEALQLGVPVIASDIPSFRELGQGIPLLLDPADQAGWEGAILAFSGNSPDRERQLGMMSGYQPLTWNDHFSDVEAWLATLPPAPRPAVKELGLPCLSA